MTRIFPALCAIALPMGTIAQDAPPPIVADQVTARILRENFEYLQAAVLRLNDELAAVSLQIDELNRFVPRNVVAAFDSADCPQGWVKFGELNGRFVVGAGIGTDLTFRALRDAGGRESKTLTIEEIPSHSHDTKHLRTARGSGNGVVNWRSGGGATTVADGVGPTGGGQAFDIMPPWYALNYCKKM